MYIRYMWKFFCAMLLLMLSGACRETPGPETVTVAERSFQSTDWPRAVQINPQAAAILNSWPEFKTFEDRFERLREVRGEEELRLLLEELIELSKELQASVFPKDFNVLSVRSRHKVVDTYLYKVQAAIIYRQDINEALQELMGAYNALREQFNVIKSSTLDPKLFEDD